ncbi:MAG: Maf family protein [Lachnospiraceae bacterium]
MINKDIPIILASASPRRAQLLTLAGYHFTVHPSNAEEVISGDNPSEIVENLAFIKANDVYNDIKGNYKNQDFLVIGADTIVYYDGDILGKPEDEKEAFDMLKMLSDRTHQVYTGIAVILKQHGEKQTYLLHEKTDVTFYPINDYEIREYIKTGDPLDKAGAYGIQGSFAVHVKEIHGDYNNVVGLPIAKLYQALKQ